MDKATGVIKIKRAILHTIKNDGKVEVKTYDNELDINIDHNEKFIIGHIQKSLKSDGRKIANFLSKNDNIIFKKFNAIKDDENNFITYSKDIAIELGRAMSGTNGSSTYLLITIFTKDNIDSVGILKLNFVENIELEEVIENGETKMTLVFKDTGVPNVNQKLQKGAFISTAKLVNEEKEYDLVLIDKNTKDGANYFKVDFLNCELVNSIKENLTNLFKVTYDFIQQEYEENPSQVFEKDKLMRGYFSTHDSLNIIELSELINTNDETRNKFIDMCTNTGIDFEFDKDSEFYNRKCGKTKYQTDTGITVEGLQSAIDDTEKVNVNKKEDGTYDIVIKGLRKISTVFK